MLIILIVSCFSQNVVPVHIAFIPVLIPPLLKIFNELEMDRRLIACVITFGLTAPYILLPVGFGKIFQGMLKDNMADAGLNVPLADIPYALIIPVAGMVVGLILSVIVYRKPKQYETKDISGAEASPYTRKSIGIAVLAIVVSLGVQLYLSQTLGVEGMIMGALAGLIVLFVSGVMKRDEADSLITDGMVLMVFYRLCHACCSRVFKRIDENRGCRVTGQNVSWFYRTQSVLGRIADAHCRLINYNGNRIFFCDDSCYHNHLCASMHAARIQPDGNDCDYRSCCCAWRCRFTCQ